MTRQDLKILLDQLKKRLEAVEMTLHLDEKRSESADLKQQMQQEGFWDAPERAQKIAQRVSQLDQFCAAWEGIFRGVRDFDELLPMMSDDECAEMLPEVRSLEQIFDREESKLLLSGEYDRANAILTLQVGNGGQDAEDFCQMLERMYIRYAERNNWKVTILEESFTDDGLRSATLEIRGDLAYGLLKSEHGVHRLIRLSPFNAKNLRQTSFARVEVLPEIEQDTDIILEEKDLRVDVFRSSGHGGQSVNTTDSAVRITYLPLGISVSCQNEKSQLQNKENALKVLKSRLLQLKLEQNAQEIQELRGEMMENSFGSQIRTYTLQPYKLVKDHRTNYEETNPDAVFDGQIEGFGGAYLRMGR